MLTQRSLSARSSSLPSPGSKEWNKTQNAESLLWDPHAHSGRPWSNGEVGGCWGGSIIISSIFVDLSAKSLVLYLPSVTSKYIPQKAMNKTYPCPNLTPYLWSKDTLGDMVYPSETHFKRKSREISFIHNMRCNCAVLLKFYTENGSIAAVFCAKFQKIGQKRNRLFARYGFKMRPWWRHQMETFSALLAICAGIRRSPVNSPHKGQWRGMLVFSLICVWINGWVNNREAGDWRRYRAHYDVTVMLRRTSHSAPWGRLLYCFDSVWPLTGRTNHLEADIAAILQMLLSE